MSSKGKHKVVKSQKGAKENTCNRDESTPNESRLSSMPVEELEALVRDVVTYLLIADRAKTSIKRQDIVKNVLKERGRLFKSIIDLARAELNDKFGIRLVELDGRHKGSFMMVSVFDSAGDDEVHCRFPEDDNIHAGIVLIILAMIFMRGGKLTEDELWETLKQFGLEVDHPHAVFGDIKKLVNTELTREGYVEITREPNVDQPHVSLTWGPRARLETCKRDVLDFVCSFTKTTPNDWPVQNKEANDEQGASANESGATEEDMEEGEEEESGVGRESPQPGCSGVKRHR